MNAFFVTGCVLSFVAYNAAATTLTLSAAKGGAVPANVNYVNFDDLSLGQATQTASGPNGSVVVVPQGNAAIVQGMVQWVYHPPWIHNNQGAFFRGQPDGEDQTPYLTTRNGSVKIEFAAPQKYLGLLWGTPDNGQTLELYSNNAGFLGAVSGTDLLSLGVVVITDDFRSAYVNINSEIPFDYAIATPSVFEFDNLAYFSEQVALPGKVLTLPIQNGSLVPDVGATIWLLGSALAGVITWSRGRKESAALTVS